jgi:hypothetical protein
MTLIIASIAAILLLVVIAYVGVLMCFIKGMSDPMP